MNRLELITKSSELAGKRILIVGCGYKPLRHIFYDIITAEPSHDSILVYDQEMKLNIGTATAGVLVLAGADVHMVSTSSEKLRNIKGSIDNLVGNEAQTTFSVVDLSNEESIDRLAKDLPHDKEVYWVQALGLSGDAYKVKNDNPYLPIEEIDPKLMEAELSVLTTTQKIMKAMLPRFKQQRETRIAIITSMSAVRGYSLGGTHCAAKAAIDRYANSAMLAFYRQPHNIFITTVRPGGVDTGMYDNQEVQKAISNVSDEYKGQYRTKQTYMPPTTIGQAIKLVFTASAHIPSMNIVAKGQFPNEGS